MKAEDCKLHQKYKSKINIIATGCEYEVVKKNKTSCWVHLWEDGKPTNIIYKNVRYNVLTSACKHDYQMFDGNSISPDYCIKCGATK